MAPPKKKGRGGHRTDASSRPRATIGTKGKKLGHEGGDAAAKSKKQAPDKETRAAQVMDSSGAAATPPGRSFAEAGKTTVKSGANTSSTSKETKQPVQQQAKRGRGRPRKQTGPGQTSTPSKVVMEQAATTKSSKTIKAKAGDRVSKKRRIESIRPPPKPSATPSASTEQKTTRDKRADHSLGSPSIKMSEVSKASPGEGQDVGSSTSKVHGKGRGGRKVTAEEPQGKKKAGSGDKGGGSRGRGRPGRPVKRKGEAPGDELNGTPEEGDRRPGRPVKRKGEALGDELDGTPEEGDRRPERPVKRKEALGDELDGFPEEAIDEEGDELGSEGSEYEDEEEAYDPMEDEEFHEKKVGGKRGRKPGGAAAKRDAGKGKDKGETNAKVPREEDDEGEEGMKEGC